MFPVERRKWIEEQILLNEKIDIIEISKKLGVSPMTIRRDLKELENNGKVIRTHGGAISPKILSKEKSYYSKQSENSEQKNLIAIKAVELIDEGATIILDSGTTTFLLAKMIRGRDDLTVVTNDIKIANELLDTKLKVILTGGVLQNNIGALVGPMAEEFLNQMHVDIFFLGTHALHLEKGVTSPSFEKSTIKHIMMKSAEKTWLLADSSKFRKKSFVKVCEIDELTGIITDNGLDGKNKIKYGEKT